jgi:uncharacterized protein (TIGR03083 family)
MPYGNLAHTTYLEHIETEGRNFVAAGRRAPIHATVASYPGFDVAGMASHVGRVARASTRALGGGTFEFEAPETVPQDESVFPWLEDALAALLESLRTVDPDTPVEHYWKREPQTAAFFARYLAVEIATHRWDEETPTGEHLPIPADLAADGIDYTLSAWVPMQGAKLEADLGGTVALEAGDTGDTWRLWSDGGALHSARGADGAGTSLVGDVSDLFLALWKRVDLPAAGIAVRGDSAPAERLLALDYVINPKTTPFH